MSTVMIIGDTHYPFVHPNYPKFLRDTRDIWKPDRVVHIGDLVDNYAFSFHDPDPGVVENPLTEMDKAKAGVKKLYEEFPNVDLIEGNHDLRPARIAKKNGIPDMLLREFDEMYDLPPGWNVWDEIEIDGVRYIHGIAQGGISSWQDYSKHCAQSTVTGHIHSVLGARYHTTPNGQMFSMTVGCGIDERAYAFAYGKGFPKRPVLGAGIVINGTQAYAIPMDMSDRRYRRIR